VIQFPQGSNFQINIQWRKIARIARIVSALTLKGEKKNRSRPEEFFTFIADKRGEIPCFVITEIVLQHTVFSANLLTSKLGVSFK